MKLSVIILNYNVQYFLAQCIQSVERAILNLDAEIIVVDNASSDNSCIMVKEKFPLVILIENKENIGFPKGNNQGVALAKGEYICILNPDTVVAEDTFSKLLSFAESQENVGIVGVKLIDGTGNFLPESKRGVPKPWVAFTKFSGLYACFPKLFGGYYAMHLNEEASGEVAILAGAFMLMKRSVYHQARGFDEGCFMYADDIDLSYRIKKLGYKNYYYSKTSVIHYKGESTDKDSIYIKRFGEALNFFYKKHFRKNWFFDVFMKLGIKIFSIVAFFKLKIEVKPKKSQPLAYYFISDDVNLQKILEEKLQKEIKMKDKENLLSFKERTEIIFDGDYLSNKEIIALMESNKNKRITFKIRPKRCNFILGSNHNSSKGEIIIF